MSGKNKNVKTAARKRSISSLFNNDKFLLAVSFVTAFFIWVAISMNSGETLNYPVVDIPVTMDLSEEAEADSLSVVSINGLAVDEFRTTVRVKGNSVTVGSLKPSDIQVYGSNLGNIVTSGSYNVTLMARQLGVKNNYDIISVVPSEVAIVVDRNVTKELELTAQITANSPVEYYMGSPALSAKSVTISGPEQSVSKVVKAVVQTTIEEELTETTVFDNLEIKLYDAENQEIKDDSLVVDPIDVSVTIPVLLKKTVPLVLNYENAPKNFSAGDFLTIEPSELEIAASPDVISSLEQITIGTLNFNEISYGMSSLSYELTMPEGVKNFNNIEKATAKFNYSGYSTKSFVITDFKFENVPQGLSASASSYRSLLVRVLGPKSEISDLKASDVTAIIDLSNAKIGTSDYSVEIRFNTTDYCWIYGTYSVSVTVGDSAVVSSSSQTVWEESDTE